MDINIGTLLGVLLWMLLMRSFARIFSVAVAAMVKEDAEAHNKILKRYAYNNKKAPE